MNLTELKEKSINELVKLAESMKLENLARTRKQDIIFAILKKHAENDNDIFGGGVLRNLYKMVLVFCALLTHLT